MIVSFLFAVGFMLLRLVAFADTPSGPKVGVSLGRRGRGGASSNGDDSSGRVGSGDCELGEAEDATLRELEGAGPRPSNWSRGESAELESDSGYGAAGLIW